MKRFERVELCGLRRWCADGDLLAAFERARSDATLAPRERELAAVLIALIHREIGNPTEAEGVGFCQA